MDKESSRVVWGATPAGTAFSGSAEPGTKEFFENVLDKRFTYEQPWLLELVPFASFAGKHVLELGCGAGYDAYQFCKHEAEYTGIDLTPENPDRTKAHLSFYGYAVELAVGDAENLQFNDETFDVVFSNGVLHHTPDIEKSFKEAYRVAKHGGEFWVIIYHKNSVFYRLTVTLADHILGLGFLKRSLRERRSMIEYTTSAKLPLVNVYSRRQLKHMLRKVGFSVESLCVRKLVKEDFPSSIQRLYPAMSQKWLDLIGRYFGWYVIAQARKK
ncbi:MAG TPA: class I SAM-dependent methyltransferase [Candidatus Aquicultor sp.]